MSEEKLSPAERIHALGRFSGRPGLHRIRALLSTLGNPQNGLRFVHIAGTNGKGSTAAMTAQIVQCAGYRTGLFTSPYLVWFHERIRVNGIEISNADLNRLTDCVLEACRSLELPEGEHIGEFEFVTAIGMLYFCEQQCDLVVLETGLGGEFDASNVIPPPVACAITAISLDHTAVLGDTIEQIARTKAGIIKAGSEAVSAPHQHPDALRVIRKACEEAGVPLFIPPEPQVIACDLSGSVFQSAGKEYHLSMIGRHQIDNALVALELASALSRQGFELPAEAVERGLYQTHFAGRLEKRGEHPLLLLDGAHNPGGVDALCCAIDEMLGMRRLLLVLGMVQDKDIKYCTEQLARRAHRVFVTEPENERALPAKELAALVGLHNTRVTCCGALSIALEQARNEAGADDCILVCGSLYLVGQTEEILGNN